MRTSASVQEYGATLAVRILVAAIGLQALEVTRQNYAATLGPPVS